MRNPRQHNAKHLDFVRSLPCLLCMGNVSTEAAHVRFSCLPAAKRPTGMGEKPHDRWTVPLCQHCHAAQHMSNERDFWAGTGIDPIFTAMALWGVTGDHEAGLQIVSSASSSITLRHCE